MINKIKQTLRGFTLIETLIAVLLLATSIAGPLSIASKGITATLVAKDQFIAFFLAQDAIEQVRFIRDSACLTGPLSAAGDCDTTVWLASLANCTGATGCYFDSLQDPTVNPPVACAVGGCPVFKYDTTLGSYCYASRCSSAPDTPQKYVRTIKIISNPSTTFADQAVVLVTVTWTDIAGVVHAPITVRELVYRWQ